MLNLHRLAILREVERRGTLAAAARALSYSPSAVSQQLAQLERETGVALTERVGRGVRLTDAARLLAAGARAAIAELERAEARLSALHALVAGRLRVATFQTGLLSLLPGAITALEGAHPEVRVDVAQRQADEAVAGLLGGGFDLVVGEEYPDVPAPRSDRVHREDLGPDELSLALPPDGPWSRAEGLADLAEALWALDPAPTAPGRWARGLCAEAGFEPRVRFDGTDLLMHLHLVEAGRAVAILPGLIGIERTRGVRIVPLAGAPSRRLFTLVRASRADDPALRALRAELAAAFAAPRVDG
ncbi:LysR family transcriptional regulator [Microbacterium sp. gxy059]|uniref:LysR family transcriptional regulator n=1 Tax=Microbacterium sp. gxy059 TaxID=2957199 RepID=UPI003D99A4BC